jgi:hypothetical protein
MSLKAGHCQCLSAICQCLRPATVTIARAIALYNEINLKEIQAELSNLECEYANIIHVLQEPICVELNSFMKQGT